MLVYPSHQVKEVQDVINNYHPNQCYLLFDENTAKHCGQIILKQFSHLKNAHQIIIPAGDQYKTMDRCVLIWDTLVKHRATRSSLLINIGGGMITDIGGFAAACYKRSIDFINIPTSLLAMVDASIGGKTSINYKTFKNQLGVFQDAKCVYVNPNFLETLPRNELHSGLAEMVKHLLMFKEDAIHFILDKPDIKDWISEDCILQNIKLKHEIVEQDYLDKGLRQSLNFGHTIGHAIESLSHVKKTPLLHGEAIMLGMIEELKLSEKLFNTPKEIREVLQVFTKKFFPFLEFKYKFEKLIPYLRQDKKNENGIRFSLLENVGIPKLQVDISIEELCDELA